MKFGSRKSIVGFVGVMLLCFAAVAVSSASRQAAPARPSTPAARPAAPRQATPARAPAAAARGPLMAEQVYTNIRVLKGLREDEFMDTMGFISGGLGVNCIFCHDTAISQGTPARWAGFAADTPRKETAR